MGAGTDSRPGPATPKQFLLLGSDREESPGDGRKKQRRQPVLAWVIHAFRSVVRDADIVVALPPEHIETWMRLCREYDVPPHKICKGGATRFESVRNALRDLDPDCEYIAVHDAARPLVSSELILRTIEVARQHGTAIPVVPLTDTVRRIRIEDGEVEGGSYPEDRATLRAVQTPQVFRADILRTGYERATGGSVEFTDDATVVESVGYNIMLCEGERGNFKITERMDFIMANAVINYELRITNYELANALKEHGM